MNLSKEIAIRMDEALNRLVQEEAKACKMTVHDYVRLLLRRGLGLKPKLSLVP